jgi:hypothetical protein
MGLGEGSANQSSGVDDVTHGQVRPATRNGGEIDRQSIANRVSWRSLRPSGWSRGVSRVTSNGDGDQDSSKVACRRPILAWKSTDQDKGTQASNVNTARPLKSSSSESPPREEARPGRCFG